MLCTLMLDAYRRDEAEDVHDALQRLLWPGQPDWSPMGVYAYWNRATHELLYVGLASDLPERFAQHNGLVHHTGGNKKSQIDDYFAGNEYLGFSVLVQSRAVEIFDLVAALDHTLGAASSDIISVGEGQLIEIHRLVHGNRPPWNATGGSQSGQRWATAAGARLEVLSGQRDSLFVCRHAIRALPWEIRARIYEAVIHAARMRTVMAAHGLFAMPAEDEDDAELMTERILQSFLVRGGHLVQDLDASDTDITTWVERLGILEGWKEERALLPEVTPHGGGGRAVKELLDAVMASAEDPPARHFLATAALLEEGYLQRPLHLPPDGG
jgi:hypothetical protein